MIEFNAVTIKYVPDITTLLNFSAKIDCNTLIIGDEFLGTSSILRLIAKIDKNYTGEILIDNANLKEIKDKDLSVAFIPKEPYLFKSTIEKNLSYVLKIRKVDKATIKEKVSFVINYLNSLTKKHNIENFPNKIKKLNEGSTLRIAFDFDGVLVDDEAEREFQTRGLTGFNKLEAAKAHTPHSPGPLSNLFARLSEIQKLDFELHGKSNPYYQPAIRISIVTSRGTPSEERLITTLKSLGMSAAELFLLDGLDKAPILEALQPHIFFDDQIKHLTSTQIHIPSVLVPFGIHNQD